MVCVDPGGGILSCALGGGVPFEPFPGVSGYSRLKGTWLGGGQALKGKTYTFPKQRVLTSKL